MAEDREGLEYQDVTEARAEAERAKVEIQAKLVDAGVPGRAITPGFVEVADSRGKVLARIPGPRNGS